MYVVSKRLDGSRFHLVRREVGLGPDYIVLDGESAPHGKGVQQQPTFRPMSIVVKRSSISATAGILLIFLAVWFSCMKEAVKSVML